MKRLEITAAIMLCFACLLTNCHHNSSPSNPAPEPTANATTVIKDGVSYLLQTDKPLYHVGEPVQIFYRATNTTNKIREFGEITYGTEMTLIINNDNEQRIWTYNNNPTAVPQGSIRLSLEPQTSLERSIEWTMVNDNGTLWNASDDFLVAPQRYLIYCGIGNHPETTVSLSFQIQ